jgi:hypothetical protein
MTLQNIDLSSWDTLYIYASSSMSIAPWSLQEQNYRLITIFWDVTPYNLLDIY